MSDTLVSQIVAAGVGVLFIVIGRLVDRFLPDPDGKHPLPSPPTISTDRQAKHLDDGS